MNPLFRIDFSISDSLKIVRKSVLIYETIILNASLFSWFYYEILENKLSTFFIPHHTMKYFLIKSSM